MLWLSQPLTASAPIVEITDGLSIINGNSLYPITETVFIKPQIYGAIISCLKTKESSNNPLAWNPNDPNGGSFGILQYQLSTFQEICVNKYKYRNEIWNDDIQTKCANEMLTDNFNNIYHWSTADTCLRE